MTVEVPDRLPKGPHSLTREQVQASQRQRILDAILDVVGEHGYATATVAHVTALAGISRTTFYEQFRSKQDAFLTAYDEFGTRFLADMDAVSAATPAEVLTAAAEGWWTGDADGRSRAAPSSWRSTPSARRDARTAIG